MSIKLSNVLVLMFFTYSAFVWSSEYSVVCSTSEKDVSDARDIVKSSKKYLLQLKRINHQSFKNINASSESVASLVDEKNKLIEAFEDIINSAEAIESKSTQCATKEWNKILYNVAFNIRYMEDMERYNLIKDCEVCWFGVMVTSTASENITIKLNEIIGSK
jgi:hypothetical protein